MAIELETIRTDESHWYWSKQSRQWFPSVTTVLSAYPKGEGFERYLVSQSSWKDAQQALKQAGERGTNVHEATEKLDSGKEIVRENYSDEEWDHLWGFVNWRKDFPWKVKDTERVLCSSKHKLGGTLDRVYFDDETQENVLIDIKTSSAIYDSYWLQVAVYAKMYEELTGEEIHRVGVVRTAPKRKKKYEYVSKPKGEWEQDLSVFDAVHKVWKNANPNETGPKTKEVPKTLVLNEK